MERGRRTWRCALGWAAVMLVAPATAPAAVTVSRAELSPSTTQAAAHPDVTITTAFQYDGDDDLRSVRVVLPQGLIGDPKAATQCNQNAFRDDNCPPDSRVGETDVTATATIVVLPEQITSHGDVYNLQPTGSEPARIGVVVRPEFAGMPQPKIFLQSPAILGPQTDYGLATEFDDLPTKSGGFDIRLDQMALTLFGRGPKGAFMTNPTKCAPAAMTVTATSYGDPDHPATGSGSFTPTGCDAVPFNPQLEGSVGDVGLTGKGKGPPVRTVVVLPSGGGNLAAVTVSLPADLAPDANQLSRSCLPEALAAVNCPASSRIGGAVASSPLSDAPLTGTVFLGSGAFPPPILVPLAGVAPLVLHGVSALPTGPGQGISNTFEGLPDLPVTRFELMLDGGPTALLKAQRDLCGAKANTNTTATFTAQSGRQVTVAMRLPVAGCQPSATASLRFRGTTGTLSARFSAAVGKAALKRLRFTLPSGLVAGARSSATRRILPRVSAGGKRLRGSAVRLRGRTLDVRVARNGARSISLRWTRLRAKGTLARRIPRRPRLTFVGRVTDAGNATTRLRLRVRPAFRRA